MNEADRIAYEEWLSSHCGPKLRVRFMPAWQAACEHKQREIYALKARVARLEGFVKMVNQVTIPDPYDEREAPPLQKQLHRESRELLRESPAQSLAQSLAEVKAETLREAAADIDDGKFYSQINPNGVELGSGGVFSKRLKERAERILQRGQR